MHFNSLIDLNFSGFEPRKRSRSRDRGVERRNNRSKSRERRRERRRSREPEEFDRDRERKDRDRRDRDRERGDRDRKRKRSRSRGERDRSERKRDRKDRDRGEKKERKPEIVKIKEEPVDGEYGCLGLQFIYQQFRSKRMFELYICFFKKVARLKQYAFWPQGRVYEISGPFVVKFKPLGSINLKQYTSDI